MMKRLIAIVMLTVFVLGTLAACVPPGHLKRLPPPGHLRPHR